MQKSGRSLSRVRCVFVIFIYSNLYLRLLKDYVNDLFNDNVEISVNTTLDTILVEINAYSIVLIVTYNLIFLPNPMHK